MRSPHATSKSRNRTRQGALSSPPTNAARVDVQQLDLSSLACVRECAVALCARYTRCDLLLLNAGVMAVQPHLTEDGHDVQAIPRYWLVSSGQPATFDVSPKNSTGAMPNAPAVDFRRLL